MSALAVYLKREGYEVSGSDISLNSDIKSLLDYAGIKVFLNQDGGENLSYCDVVIYSNAISELNREFLAAKNMGKAMISRAELLSAISNGYDKKIFIAGSHGKTTATCMLAHILKESYSPTAHIGGLDLSYGNLLYGDKKIFISEVCEYKKNILKMRGGTAVVLNISPDHMECYEDENDLYNTFYEFLDNSDKAVINADDKVLQRYGRAIRYGIDSEADYRAANIVSEKGYYTFDLFEGGNKSLRIKLNVIGRHNIYNALAAIAAARAQGASGEDIMSGISNFKGVKRRGEKIGKINGSDVYADYAHHPDEIIATLKSFEEMKLDNLTVLFQPHTYSRTKSLMPEFIGALSKVKDLIIFDTYAAREKFDYAGSARHLAEKMGCDKYFDCDKTLADYLKSELKDKTLLVLGAGDIYDRVKRICDE